MVCQFYKDWMKNKKKCKFGDGPHNRWSIRETFEEEELGWWSVEVSKKKHRIFAGLFVAYLCFVFWTALVNLSSICSRRRALLERSRFYKKIVVDYNRRLFFMLTFFHILKPKHYVEVDVDVDRSRNIRRELSMNFMNASKTPYDYFF